MQKTSIEQYKEFQEYTNYIDTSDVMLGFYKDQSGTALEKYFLMIEEWLSLQDKEENTPLVIQAEGGIGKKTLLVKWYEYHQSLKKNSRSEDLIILNFATTGGNNSNYYYAIYRILIKLREELNIKQKVELHEEKLRKYFAYWLDVCNQRIQNESLQSEDMNYQKIILVFEGIDYFLDRSTGKEGNIAFWLPKLFPNNVKVIVTADTGSESMRYFDKLGCAKVSISSDTTVAKWMSKEQYDKETLINGSIKQELLQILDYKIKESGATTLFAKAYLACILPEKMNAMELAPKTVEKVQSSISQIDTGKLKELKNIEELFNFITEFWGKVIFKSEEKLKQIVGLLLCTQKGLRIPEIIATVKVDLEDLKLFFTVFRIFLMNFKDLWMIKNDIFKKIISKKYVFNTVKISQKIAQALRKTPNSVRKLEEETYQLYYAGNYFRLKEVISDIENFLLLFNPYTKYDLCRYWQKLEEKSFDPVIEYNKAIEGFEMHYHPTSEDLFRIITQISRFLREFSDFETYYTPEFRHPKIIGNVKELNDLGVLGQFRNLALCEDENSVEEDGNSLYYNELEKDQKNSEEAKLKKKLQETYEKIEQGKHIKKISKLDYENKDSARGQKKQTPKKKKDAPVRIQQLNVEVKANEEAFRSYYYNEITPFLKKVGLEGEKEGYIIDAHEEEEDESEEEADSLNLVLKIKNIEKDKEKSKFQDLPELKNLYAKTVEQEFQLSQKAPTNYCYKRWIWMQFPWVCMTLKCDYSAKLRECFTSPTSYMSVSEEREFTLQVLKIALQAKKKKQAILEKKVDNSRVEPVPKVSGVRKASPDASKQNSKFQPNETQLSRKISKKSKMEELGFVTNSFLSLNTLSKELENINCQSKLNGPNKSSTRHDDYKQQSMFITSDEKSSMMENGASRLTKSKKKNNGNMNDSTDNLSILKKSKQGLLPRIKQNVNNCMIKELTDLEKSNSLLRKEMDDYLYKNKVLAKRLKELKIIQFNNLNQFKNEKKLEEQRNRIAQIEHKIQKVKDQYVYSLVEHDRLNVLIKVCRANKTHNEETIPELVAECNNFKKMIRLESDNIQELKKKTDEVKKLTKKFVANCNQKIQNQLHLQQEINTTKKNRQHFNQEIQRYDSMIAQEIQDKRKEINQKLHHSGLHKKEDDDMPKKNQSSLHISQEDVYQDMYRKLSEHVDLENQNYKQDPNYQKLLYGLTKKREFEVIIEERKVQLDQLQKEYQEEKRNLQTLERAKEQSRGQEKQAEENESVYESPTEANKHQLELEKTLTEKKRQLQKTTDIKLSCLGMLNTWYARLGLPEQSKLEITGEFLQKLKEVREIKQGMANMEIEAAQ